MPTTAKPPTTPPAIAPAFEDLPVSPSLSGGGEVASGVSLAPVVLRDVDSDLELLEVEEAVGDTR